MSETAGPAVRTGSEQPGPGSIVVIHADESCLGNGLEPPNPGGAAALVERRGQGGIVRRDLYISAPDTTNNRMALCGAIAVLACLSNQGRYPIVYVSDSEYLVKGMNEWVKGWEQRGWKRKGGAVENLELWQALTQVSRQHRVAWRWVRGHAGNPKNEYANDQAVRAAERQETSAGLVESKLDAWLTARQARGRFTSFDPDAEFVAMEREITG